MNALEREVMVAQTVLSYESYLAKLMSRVLSKKGKEIKELDEQAERFDYQLLEDIKKQIKNLMIY